LLGFLSSSELLARVRYRLFFEFATHVLVFIRVLGKLHKEDNHIYKFR
jgi:hypothetical protein